MSMNISVGHRQPKLSIRRNWKIFCWLESSHALVRLLCSTVYFLMSVRSLSYDVADFLEWFGILGGANVVEFHVICSDVAEAKLGLPLIKPVTRLGAPECGDIGGLETWVGDVKGTVEDRAR